MVKKVAFILFCGLFQLTVAGQSSVSIIEGKVTFITSQNVYVKFINTSEISVGDTLKLEENGQNSPCLIVIKKSSTSCVCTPIKNCLLAKDNIVLFEKIDAVAIEPEIIDSLISEQSEYVEPFETKAKLDKPNIVKRKESVRARASVASYSSLPEERDADHRLLYRFSLNANHINDSKWSAESYINFRQNLSLERQNINALRIYNLAARYDIDSTWNFVIGRKINNKASSLGPIDGIQTEKFLGNYFIGAIVGFRPDFTAFDFNPNLLEYGSYAGFSKNTNNVYAQSTLGLLEQRNLGKVDRRYAYFQHNSTINSNLNLFASMELDLYTKVDDVANVDLRLTNLYVSARYRFNRRINLTLSYDSRRRIIFYETLRTEIERLLADDEARQGIRIRLNVSPFKYVNAGVAYNMRFRMNDQNNSQNINGFLSLSKLPIGGRSSFNYNYNTSSYLKSQIFSFTYSRPLFQSKLNMDLYFRNVNYTYLGNEVKIMQNYFGAGFSYRLSKSWMFNVLGELSTRRNEENYRLNTKIIKRFGK